MRCLSVTLFVKLDYKKSFAYIHQELHFELNFEPFFLMGDIVGETVIAYIAVVLSRTLMIRLNDTCLLNKMRRQGVEN